MNKIYIGKIVNTHGIKGELRIKDDLNDIQKEEIFKIGTNLLINDNNYTIASYRCHKDYDMVTFKGFNNINDVLFMKGASVYKDPTLINLDTNNILDSELITYKVITKKGDYGFIKKIEKTGTNYKIIRCVINNKEYLIPYHFDFIKINKSKKEIEVKLIEV